MGAGPGKSPPPCRPHQVGRKWVQMLTVSLVIWKELRIQSKAELLGCRYPDMMPSSQKI